MKYDEATKLMISDWVYLKKSKDEPTWCGLAQITEIGEDYVSIDLKEKIEDFPGSVAFHAVEPIPLTAEILEKNFPNPTDGLSWFPEEGGFNCHTYVPNCEINAFGLFKYVHELQNAIKLCGINKEIIL